MELDDLRNTWNEKKVPVRNQQCMALEIMEEMHNRNYRSKMRKIMVPEIVGGIICLAAAAYIGLNFDYLDNSLLQGAGVSSILLLLLLPILSTVSTWQLNTAYDVNTSYAETLKAFANQKVRFVKLQKLNVTLSYLLLISIIVLMSKLVGGKDLSGNKYFWLFSFTIGYIFLLLFSKWVEKYYRKTLQHAEELLKDLAA